MISCSMVISTVSVPPRSTYQSGLSFCPADERWTGDDERAGADDGDDARAGGEDGDAARAGDAAGRDGKFIGESSATRVASESSSSTYRLAAEARLPLPEADAERGDGLERGEHLRRFVVVVVVRVGELRARRIGAGAGSERVFCERAIEAHELAAVTAQHALCPCSGRAHHMALTASAAGDLVQSRHRRRGAYLRAPSRQIVLKLPQKTSAPWTPST